VQSRHRRIMMSAAYLTTEQLSERIDPLRRPDDPRSAQGQRPAGGGSLRSPVWGPEALVPLGSHRAGHRLGFAGPDAAYPHGERRDGPWLRSESAQKPATSFWISAIAASVAASRRR